MNLEKQKVSVQKGKTTSFHAFKPQNSNSSIKTVRVNFSWCVNLSFPKTSILLALEF